MFSWFGKVSFVPYTKVSEFAVHLREGRLMGSECSACGFKTFPPRADCPECRSPEFTYRQVSGRGTLFTWSRIDAAPTGFEDLGSYVVAVVDLDEGGRLLGWLGDSIAESDIEIGMEVRVVPRIFEDIEPIRLYYTVERPTEG